METLAKEYIESKRLAWAESTLRSESLRLNKLLPFVNGDPRALWDHLDSSYKPYSKVTSYTRVMCFYEWAINEGRIVGPNPYKKFRSNNARLFKNFYTKKYPAITFEEAEKRIKRIKDSDVRAKAMELLKNGMRYTESFTRTEDDFITGKGGKVRKVFGPRFSLTESLSYDKLRKALKKEADIKPHDLRKLFAMKLYRNGVDPRDVKEIMGWNSFETAMSYLGPQKEDELKKMVQSV